MIIKTRLAKRRDAKDLNQEQMAALLKTCQSEISKTEAGELPPEKEIGRWARAYGATKKQFRADCESARWDLELWRFVVKTPAEIETIDCTIRKAQ